MTRTIQRPAHELYQLEDIMWHTNLNRAGQALLIEEQVREARRTRARKARRDTK